MTSHCINRPRYKKGFKLNNLTYKLIIMEKKTGLSPLPFIFKTQLLKYEITDDFVKVHIELNRNTDVESLVLELSNQFNCTHTRSVLFDDGKFLSFFGYYK